MDEKKGKGAGFKLKTLKKYISEKNIIQALRYVILALLVCLCGAIALASLERGTGLPVIITLASAIASGMGYANPNNLERASLVAVAAVLFLIVLVITTVVMLLKKKKY